MKVKPFFSLLFPVVLIFTISCLCSSSNSAQPVVPDTVPVTKILTPVTGTITGRVTNAGDGFPFQGAKVHLKELATLTATSNSLGQYTLLGIPPGEYKIFATSPGWGSGELDVFVWANKTTSPPDLKMFINIQLPTPGRTNPQLLTPGVLQNAPP